MDPFALRLAVWWFLITTTGATHTTYTLSEYSKKWVRKRYVCVYVQVCIETKSTALISPRLATAKKKRAIWPFNHIRIRLEKETKGKKNGMKWFDNKNRRIKEEKCTVRPIMEKKKNRENVMIVNHTGIILEYMTWWSKQQCAQIFQTTLLTPCSEWQNFRQKKKESCRESKITKQWRKFTK